MCRCDAELVSAKDPVTNRVPCSNFWQTGFFLFEHATVQVKFIAVRREIFGPQCVAVTLVSAWPRFAWLEAAKDPFTNIPSRTVGSMPNFFANSFFIFEHATVTCEQWAACC